MFSMCLVFACLMFVFFAEYVVLMFVCMMLGVGFG